MSSRLVAFIADAMCPPSARSAGSRDGWGAAGPPCELCQIGAQRAYEALAEGGYLRDPDAEAYRQAAIEAGNP